MPPATRPVFHLFVMPTKQGAGKWRRNRGSPDHDRPGSQFIGVSALAWSRGNGRGGHAPTVYAVSPLLRPAGLRRSTATGQFSVEKPGTTSAATDASDAP